jgi:uncharacterized glyoxalase superfamily protein PhnB
VRESNSRPPRCKRGATLFRGLGTHFELSYSASVQIVLLYSASQLRPKPLSLDAWPGWESRAQKLRAAAQGSKLDAGVKPNRSIPQATVIPVLIYPDVRQAVDWLARAFGFIERVRIGENHRSQLRFREGAVIVGDVRGERQPPRRGEVTHSVMVRVDNANAHCERAKAHGARIVMEPTDFEYGERQYTAEDPAGHQWTFSETLTDVAPEVWGGTSISPE